MLYVKIMSAEDIPDTDPYKNYAIIPVENNQTMHFVKNPDWQPMPEGAPDMHRFELHVSNPDGSWETHYMLGNAYVMNERGQTIASHGA